MRPYYDLIFWIMLMLLLAMLALMTLPGSAGAAGSAELSCTRTELSEFIGEITRRHGELVTHSGINHAGWLMTVLVEPEKRTFTILLTEPKGDLTCLLQTGDGWRNVIVPQGTGL